MASLLDVNVLLALLWPAHPSHAQAIRWFVNNREQGWATCPHTEVGFLRVVCNPAFSPAKPCFEDAAKLLSTSKAADPCHNFWKEGIPSEELALRIGKRVSGHRQVRDAYLLALVTHHRGTLVTFDRRIQQLAPPDSAEHGSFVVLES